MPSILSKLRGEARAHPAAAAALLCGGAVALVGCALRRSRAPPHEAPHSNGKCPDKRNNNVYKAGRCREDDCRGTQCPLCRGDAHCDNRQRPDTEEDEGSDSSKSSQGLLPRVPGLNVEFIKQLITLIRIMIPGPKSKEAMILSVHTLCLFTRTFLSIYVASLEGSLVKYIVKKDLKNFSMMLLQWLGIAVPATFINSMIRYLENKLALAFRTRLVKHAYNLYFQNQTFYRVGNLDGRIENPEHRLTDDVSTLATSCAHLYGHLTKPCFDLLLISFTLARFTTRMKANIFTGPALAVAVIGATGLCLKALSPGFGALASEEARRRAEWRHAHARLTQHSEEVAFYAGHNVEKRQLLSAYKSLSEQMMCVYRARLWYVMLEQFCMKYVWSGTGMVMLALPILTGKDSSVNGVGERTQYLTTSKNLLTSGADAVERLMSSYKEIVTLAGYAERVWTMLNVFGEVAEGKYILTSVHDGEQLTKYSPDNKNGFRLKFHNGQPVSEGIITYSSDHTISLRSVPIVTPGCDIVVSKLDIDIRPGHHLLIVGPNGCGKSSLFRIISGLWPIYGGELKVPEPCTCVNCSSSGILSPPSSPTLQILPLEEDSDSDLEGDLDEDLTQPILTGHCERRPIMFYIPQRPYMTVGSLAEQVSYPAPAPKGKAGSRRARAILRLVRLDHVLRRHGLYAHSDWRATLSGGEKQRMAMARMFYHRPVYALLDECTSAVSAETEVTLYEAALQQGITLLSITHRPSVWKYHTHILEFDGQGNWSHRPLSADQKELPKSTEATISAQKTTEKSP